ncbi:HindIII family type II restriction endonuclease [Lonepinella sp. BR2271]|uniref:HindIII family type II restriction endonuclease n=1 Tax=Lonepinella sp. BR2271 TaxID=3434550 RepID=UPI003F6DB47B
MFQSLIAKLEEFSQLGDFVQASIQLDSYIRMLPKADFFELLKNIGIIPECIEHDSSAEKLFSKASDSLLSRVFCELGLKSSVLTERADSADVIAKSNIYDYEVVADAKAFRLSRTAKNQKDFKVEALSLWRKNSDYAVLSSPYFQYPTTSSQIYAQSLNKNVCLLSWEHLLFLIHCNVKESKEINLSKLWNFSSQYAEKCSVADSKKCFISAFNRYFCQIINQDIEHFNTFLNQQIGTIVERGEIEKTFWLNEENSIKGYTREQAITELLKTKKIHSKIKQIDKYIKGLSL